MGILSRLFPSGRVVSEKRNNQSARQQGSLVHVFVFDSGEAGIRDPRYVSNLVRSLLPESMAYTDALISFFTDRGMPSTVGQNAQQEEEPLTRYPFACAKAKETQPSLVERSTEGRKKFTNTWQEYKGEEGNRGVVVAFYSVVEPGGIKPRASGGTQE